MHEAAWSNYPLIDGNSKIHAGFFFSQHFEQGARALDLQKIILKLVALHVVIHVPGAALHESWYNARVTVASAILAERCAKIFSSRCRSACIGVRYRKASPSIERPASFSTGAAGRLREYPDVVNQLPEVSQRSCAKRP